MTDTNTHEHLTKEDINIILDIARNSNNTTVNNCMKRLIEAVILAHADDIEKERIKNQTDFPPLDEETIRRIKKIMEKSHDTVMDPSESIWERRAFPRYLK